jgi:XTP/dITP diphosphohydrolase
MGDLQIVLATRNQGKVTEFRKLVKGIDIDIKGLNDFGPIPDVVEDGKTFEDNAYKKAYFTAKVLGIPSLADDSGLVVEALDGEPGVYSARYAGENATDKDNNLKLLASMEGIENRKAAFKTVLAIALPSGPALIYEGMCEGEILKETRGEHGFGYDPVFYYPEFKKTFAQMSPEEKNSVSHRGKAMAEFIAEIDKVLLWLEQEMDE